ncbi:MAG: carboxypeptidase regulatory-like domain-containing protein [Acidobacteriota bacterium]|nr:carboxypeptidase regulatory-like domain-containing protein [Acidobacteriota bacterium]
MNWKAVAIWAGACAVAVALIVTLLMRTHRWQPRLITIQGAVMRRDGDARRQVPISDTEVTASDGVSSVTTRSDASGYFILTLKAGVWPRQTVNLNFRHPEYRPLNMQTEIGLRKAAKRLYVAAMEPIAPRVSIDAGHPASVVSNIRIRYTVNSQKEENIGSAVRVFQVVNQGNVPCNGQSLCSPDGSWKAATGSTSLDAGLGNEFRNVRASCIAGPCPFTRIDASGFQRGGRTVTASALDWSDTTTFLLEAEVFRASMDSSVRRSYPVIYDRTLNFTLPITEEGVSIEAEIDGMPMVFPLGPELYLSWATCVVRTNTEGQKSSVYRCELKPGYRF